MKPPSRLAEVKKEATESDDEPDEAEANPKTRKETEDFVIDKIVNHRVKKSRNKTCSAMTGQQYMLAARFDFVIIH